jgi:hypothetical protein
MYYQENPVFTIVIIFFALGAYVFFKSRGKNKGNLRTGFLSGRSQQQGGDMNNLITFMMLQQFLDSDSHDYQIKVNTENTQKHRDIDKIKEEVLELLNED